MTNSIVNEYFNWLILHIDGSPVFSAGGYIKLLTYLYNTEFRWIIPNDKNRALDGMMYRDLFASGDMKVRYILDNNLPCPCSILEMLIAMAIRCEFDIMHDPDQGDNTHIWFWNMIDNLHLSYYTDDRFDEQPVSLIIWNWLDRLYSPSGDGGLFPLKDPVEDCRNVEIWGLLNRWISENYNY